MSVFVLCKKTALKSEGGIVPERAKLMLQDFVHLSSNLAWYELFLLLTKYLDCVT